MSALRREGTRFGPAFAILISIQTIVCLALIPAVAAAQKAAPSASPETTDFPLSGRLGTWSGTFASAADTLYAEAVGSLGVNRQWVDVHLRCWKDKEHTKLIYEGRESRHGAGSPDEFKSMFIDSNGSIQLGHGQVKNGVCTWIWSYDDGKKEMATETNTGGRFNYRSTVRDQNNVPVGTINVRLTKRSAAAAKN